MRNNTPSPNAHQTHFGSTPKHAAIRSSSLRKESIVDVGKTRKESLSEITHRPVTQDRKINMMHVIDDEEEKMQEKDN
ncbi:hypothetical protein HDV06_006411 [Boothiomyces sp. JEL0866]|nr:hypothetical protein HDV06_006411 [Boothiomyces sp. JEL0866]